MEFECHNSTKRVTLAESHLILIHGRRRGPGSSRRLPAFTNWEAKALPWIGNGEARSIATERPYLRLKSIAETLIRPPPARQSRRGFGEIGPSASKAGSGQRTIKSVAVGRSGGIPALVLERMVMFTRAVRITYRHLTTTIDPLPHIEIRQRALATRIRSPAFCVAQREYR
jgi:hypothetical protein